MVELRKRSGFLEWVRPFLIGATAAVFTFACAWATVMVLDALTWLLS